LGSARTGVRGNNDLCARPGLDHRRLGQRLRSHSQPDLSRFGIFGRGVTQRRGNGRPHAVVRKLKASIRKPQQAAPASCTTKELRPTLTAKRRIVPKRPTTFQLSLINGSAQTCVARVTRKNFQLKINSGSDPIWSTDDCPSMIKTVSRKLRSEHAVAWSLTWNGKRSKSRCKSASQSLRPGRYVATAQLDGAEPVKLRMVLN
jgi:hypothetical protein